MRRNQRGFTIVELMIATLIFSVVLVTITLGIMYFTHSYYKGVYVASTQDAARSISEQISQAIEFSKTNVIFNVDSASGAGYLCAGSQEFVFSLGKEYDPATVTTISSHGLAAIPWDGAGCPDPSAPGYVAPASSDIHDLLSNKMRLANLGVVQSGSAYTVDVVVAYGDNDLLCTPDVSGSCTSNTPLTDIQTLTDNLLCKNTAGSQYCAVSRISTTVDQRIKI